MSDQSSEEFATEADGRRFSYVKLLQQSVRVCLCCYDYHRSRTEGGVSVVEGRTYLTPTNTPICLNRCDIAELLTEERGRDRPRLEV